MVVARANCMLLCTPGHRTLIVVYQLGSKSASVAPFSFHSAAQCSLMMAVSVAVSRACRKLILQPSCSWDGAGGGLEGLMFCVICPSSPSRLDTLNGHAPVADAGDEGGEDEPFRSSMRVPARLFAATLASMVLFPLGAGRSSGSLEGWRKGAGCANAKDPFLLLGAEVMRIAGLSAGVEADG